MPSVNDVIKASFIQEYRGKSIVNAAHFQIDDLGSDPNLPTAALALLNYYADQVKAFCVDTWAATCIVMENETQNEGKTIVQFTTAGLIAANGHGPSQVLRINQYANQADFMKIHRGAWNQSGVAASLSDDESWLLSADFAPLKDFLKTVFILPGGLWTLQPMLKWTSAPGPPPVFTTTPVIKAQESGRVLTLQSRKTQLCATA